jgi:1,6-anhydro-N-acetylmuramate kinase
MSAKQKAVEDIKKLARQLKGLIDVAEDLEKMGSLEQAMRETAMRMDVYKDEETKALGEKVKAEQALALVHSEALQASESAKESTQKMIQSAGEKAQGLLDAAKEEARILIANALASKEQIEREAFGAKEVLNVIVEDIAKKQAALKDLNTQIEMIRKKVN